MKTVMEKNSKCRWYIVKKTDLAWAAGLFDGEGTTGFYKRVMVVSINQVDRWVLDKFQKIVGLGKVYGPYKRPNPKHAPIYHWATGKIEHIKSVFYLLKPYLGPIKIKQFNYVITSQKKYKEGEYERRSIAKKEMWKKKKGEQNG